MRYKIKNKLISLFDYTGGSNRSLYFTILSVVSYFLGNFMGFSGVISVLVFLIAVTAMGTIIQVIRKDGEKKNLIVYLSATLLLSFITVMVWLIQHYGASNDDIGLANTIKVFLSVIAICIDIWAVFIMSHPSNSKSKKILFVVCGVYMTIMSILSIIYLPFRNL